MWCGGGEVDRKEPRSMTVGMKKSGQLSLDMQQVQMLRG